MHTALRIEGRYSGPVVHVQDASRSVAVVGTLLDPVRRDRPFDLVMANILAGPLAELAPDMRNAVARRGLLILSGILSGQESRVLCRYRAAGFRLRRRIVKGTWSSYLLTFR